MTPLPVKKILDVAIVYNRSNNSGLKKDTVLLEAALAAAAKENGQSIGKVKHLDPREVPVMCDIIVHLEIPYYAWFPYGRYNIVMVNPEWWVSEAYDAYIPEIDLLLFKNESALETFKVVCSLPDEKCALVPWCAVQQAPLVAPVREFIYLVGGSINKANAAKSVVSLWKPSYPVLNIYTNRNDFEFGEAGVDNNNTKENVKVVRKELEAGEVIHLQRKHFGHCCASEAEGFGYTAAEAEMVGAFALLNHNDAYNYCYSGDNYVRFLPTTQVANDKTRSSQYQIDISGASAVLDGFMDSFMNEDIEICMKSRIAKAEQRRKDFTESVKNVFARASQGVEASRAIEKVRHMPPVLTKDECPPISIVTLIYNRRKFWDLALHNMMITDYPRDKLEWVIVDDSDDMEQSISDKIAKIQGVLPGVNVIYVPYHEKITIGGKRNLGTKRATHDIILMMDDDDHYPETSFRRRVAYLANNPGKGCAACTTIALYDLRTGISAVNVPPYDLPLGKRISEATLTFRRSFYLDRKFEKISMAEGDPFIQGREKEVIEMMPQHIIVSFCHGSNSSSRRIPPSDVKPACFWGFPAEFLKFVHKLAGVEIELQDASSSSTSAAATPRRSSST
jgi:hypothetical protein